jgi:glyoxylase-like metal-dependent hydrolase (beta-lactamase superfamily II)
MDVTHEIYAIRYAHLERTARHNFIDGDPHDGPMPLDYFVWAIIGGGRTWVVDTGFDAPMAAQRRRTLVRPVGEGLKAIGIDPAGVQDVIITHMHYDHSGNHTLFPAARAAPCALPRCVAPSKPPTCRPWWVACSPTAWCSTTVTPR